MKSKFERENDGKSQRGISKIKLKWDLTSEFSVFSVFCDLRKLTTISITFRATGRQFEFLRHNSTTWLLLCMTTIKTNGGKRRILPNINKTPTHLFCPKSTEIVTEMRLRSRCKFQLFSSFRFAPEEKISFDQMYNIICAKQLLATVLPGFKGMQIDSA